VHVDFQVTVSQTFLQMSYHGWRTSFYLVRILSLPAKWKKCTELKGDYTEKNNKTFCLVVLYHIQADNFLRTACTLVSASLQFD